VHTHHSTNKNTLRHSKLYESNYRLRFFCTQV
jgi:hypothetical protein